MPTHTFHPVVCVCSSLDDICDKARNFIADYGTTHGVAEKRVSLALSGGSTPRKLLQALHEKNLALFQTDKRFTLFCGDDRLVPLDDERSNYCMAYDALLHDVPSECIIPINPLAALATTEDPVGGEHGARLVAADFEKKLLSSLPCESVTTASGKSMTVPVVDIVLLGFGSDGHTASIFPDSIAAADEDSVVSISFPSPTMVPKVWRATLTTTVIQHAKKVVVLAAGAEKSWVIDGVLSEDTPSNCPVSRFLRGCKGEVIFFIDEAATAKQQSPP